MLAAVPTLPAQKISSGYEDPDSGQWVAGEETPSAQIVEACVEPYKSHQCLDCGKVIEPTPPAQEAEPVAFRMRHYLETEERDWSVMPIRFLERNNQDCYVIELLYTHAPSDKLRQAVEEAIKLLEDSSGGYCREAANLRAALEGKS
jgi:hypothetical protein